MTQPATIELVRCCQLMETYRNWQGDLTCSACNKTHKMDDIIAMGIKLTKYDLCRRDGLILYCCVECGARKLDCDLFEDGLCGDCTSKRRRIIIWLQVNNVHHCKKHDEHDSLCKKCAWWTKAGKCQKRKKLDPDKLYAEILEHYLKKGDRTNPDYVKKANEMAQLVVSRAIAENSRREQIA